MGVTSLFPVSSPICESMDSHVGRSPQCGGCPAESKCLKSHAKLPKRTKSNGIAVLCDQPVAGSESGIIHRAATAAGLNPDHTLYFSPYAADHRVWDYANAKTVCHCCRPYLYSRLQALAPDIRLLFVMGYPSMWALYGTRCAGRTIAPSGKDNADPMDRWRGWQIPDGLLGMHVLPLHGYPILSQDREKRIHASGRIFKDDVAAGMKLYQQPRPTQPDYESMLHYNYTDSQLDAVITDVIKSNKPIAIDYETTGLKPQGEGHRIICLSFANSRDCAHAFMLDTPRRIAQAKRILESGNRKVAANMKFEELWTRVHLQTRVKNWFWDTMLMGHVLDNRDSASGVKFQAFVQFGLPEYNSAVEKDLTSGTGNALNRVDNIHPEDLLKYCAMDSLIEYRLFCKQWTAMKGWIA